jgi:hypothetical protein
LQPAQGLGQYYLLRAFPEAIRLPLVKDAYERFLSDNAYCRMQLDELYRQHPAHFEIIVKYFTFARSVLDPMNASFLTKTPQQRVSVSLLKEQIRCHFF